MTNRIAGKPLADRSISLSLDGQLLAQLDAQRATVPPW
jgi:hypothetical protein